MFCKNCGCKLKENAKFCPQCGTAVTYKIDKAVDDVDVIERNEAYSEKQGKKSKKFVWVIIVALIAVAIAVISALVIVQKDKTAKKYEQCIQDGKYYLEEMKYVQAETEFLKAIEIDPKQKEPYIGLADVYVACEKYEKARDILNDAIDSADLNNDEENDIQDYIDEIEEKINSPETETEEIADDGDTIRELFEQYYEEELKPTYGEVSNMNHENIDSRAILLENDINARIPDGIVSYFIEDMDNDGYLELHLIRSQAVNNSYGYLMNQLIWDVYECEDDIVKLSASESIIYYDNIPEMCTFNVYIKEIQGKKYIYAEADGYNGFYKDNRYENIFEYSKKKINICKSIMTLGGGGTTFPIYASDSKLIYFTWSGNMNKENWPSSSDLIYEWDGSVDEDEEEYNYEKYMPALNKTLSEYSISMLPIDEKLELYQYWSVVLYDICLADPTTLGKQLLHYELIVKSYEDEESLDEQDIQYEKTIESVKDFSIPDSEDLDTEQKESEDLQQESSQSLSGADLSKTLISQQKCYEPLLTIDRSGSEFSVLMKNVSTELNVRSQPTYDSELVCKVGSDEQMLYFGEWEIGLGSDGEQHIWCKVDNIDTEGWVRSDLVMRVDGIYYQIKNGNDVNLRAKAKHQSNLVTTVTDEQPMYFFGEIEQGLGSDGKMHDWYKLYLGNGIEGWVRSDLIQEGSQYG